jgi:hypothetical protein
VGLPRAQNQSSSLDGTHTRRLADGKQTYPQDRRRICEVTVRVEEAPKNAADLDELLARRFGGEGKTSRTYRMCCKGQRWHSLILHGR